MGNRSDDDRSDDDGPRSSTHKCLLDEDHRRHLLHAQPLLYSRSWLLRRMPTVRWALGQGTPATGVGTSPWRHAGYWRWRGYRDQLLWARELWFGPARARPVAFWRRHGRLSPARPSWLHSRRSHRWRLLREAMQVATQQQRHRWQQGRSATRAREAEELHALDRAAELDSERANGWW